MTEHSFQGISPSPLREGSVTHVMSGTMCHLIENNAMAKFHPWQMPKHAGEHWGAKTTETTDLDRRRSSDEAEIGRKARNLKVND
jgi:hypothetical protein